MATIKNSIDMLNSDQKQQRKGIKELENKVVEVTRLMPRCGGLRSLRGFCSGTWMGPPQTCGIQEKDQVWGEYGEFHLGHVEIQVFEG